jgi:hypothetical protein
MGISEQTFYRWKKLYGGLGVGALRRLLQDLYPASTRGMGCEPQASLPAVTLGWAEFAAQTATSVRQRCPTRIATGSDSTQ